MRIRKTRFPLIEIMWIVTIEASFRRIYVESSELKVAYISSLTYNINRLNFGKGSFLILFFLLCLLIP